MGVNLLLAFEAYLILVLAFGLLQLRRNIDLYRFALRFPQRWPNLFQVAAGNLGSAITLPTVTVLVLTACLWALTIAARTLVWPDAHVDLDLLRRTPVALAGITLSAGAMVAWDVAAVRPTAKRSPKRWEWMLNLMETALVEPHWTPLRPLVHWRARKWVHAKVPLLGKRMGLYAGAMAIRAAFGFVLWTAWWVTR